MAVTSLQGRLHPDCYPSKEKDALAFFREGLSLVKGAKFPAPKGGLVGIVTPHIDFRVSLKAYAAAFAPLVEAGPAENYLILGVGHRSRLEWNLDRRDYVTPLGRAECAVDLVERMGEGIPEARVFGPAGHQGEHSIEFSLVWLQALHRLAGDKKPVRFIPLLCGGMHGYIDGNAPGLGDLPQLAKNLAGLLRELGPEKLRIIVSIDGCHLGPRFQHPFEVDEGILEETAMWEEQLWEVAERGKLEEFLEWMQAEGNDRYFDGVGALALLLASGAGRPQRTYYEQWFTERDASAVTFSSGYVVA